RPGRGRAAGGAGGRPPAAGAGPWAPRAGAHGHGSRGRDALYEPSPHPDRRAAAVDESGGPGCVGGSRGAVAGVGVARGVSSRAAPGHVVIAGSRRSRSHDSNWPVDSQGTGTVARTRVPMMTTLPCPTPTTWIRAFSDALPIAPAASQRR